MKIILIFNNKTFKFNDIEFGLELSINSGNRHEFLMRKFKEFAGEDLLESFVDQSYEEDGRYVYYEINKLDEFINMLNGFDKEQLCCLDEVQSADSGATLWINKFQYDSKYLSANSKKYL
tara:strand:- start:1202 stop:1561 length:360 start_codon:yes stop_codon:yes gene_type:complete